MLQWVLTWAAAEQSEQEQVPHGGRRAGSECPAKASGEPPFIPWPGRGKWKRGQGSQPMGEASGHPSWPQGTGLLRSSPAQACSSPRRGATPACQPASRKVRTKKAGGIAREWESLLAPHICRCRDLWQSTATPRGLGSARAWCLSQPWTSPGPHSSTHGVLFQWFCARHFIWSLHSPFTEHPPHTPRRCWLGILGVVVLKSNIPGPGQDSHDGPLHCRSIVPKYLVLT